MTSKRRRCREQNPESDSASPFSDYWYLLCFRWEGHEGEHRDAGGPMTQEAWPNTKRTTQGKDKA